MLIDTGKPWSFAQNLHFNLTHCVFFLKADQFFTAANSWTSEAVSSCSSARRESMRGMRQTKFMSNLGLLSFSHIHSMDDLFRNRRWLAVCWFWRCKTRIWSCVPRLIGSIWLFDRPVWTLYFKVGLRFKTFITHDWSSGSNFFTSRLSVYTSQLPSIDNNVHPFWALQAKASVQHLRYREIP